MYLQNLHTHGKLCDGKDEYEDIVLRAIALNFESIGFSSHSQMSYSNYLDWTDETTEQYKKIIYALKEKYKGIIDIYCGIEFDMYSEDKLENYEYVIGSVHYLEHKGNILAMDRSAEHVQGLIDTYFGGDGLEYARCYYENLAKLPQYCKQLDIVGHFDLLEKHIEKHFLFDNNSQKYKNYALDALHELIKKVKVFEVNTGAIARGYRTTPYPSEFILKEIKNLGGGVIISSDCHDLNYLDYKFDQAIEYVKSCGFKEVLKFNGKTFDAISLK